MGLAWQVANTNGPVLDDDILADKEVMDAIDRKKSLKKEWDIVNTDRAVGARVSGLIAKKWGNKRFAAEGGTCFHMVFKGSAGQSFGAFTLPVLNCPNLT